MYCDNPPSDSLTAATALQWDAKHSLLSVQRRLEDVQLLIAASRLQG